MKNRSFDKLQVHRDEIIKRIGKNNYHYLLKKNTFLELLILFILVGLFIFNIYIINFGTNSLLIIISFVFQGFLIQIFGISKGYVASLRIILKKYSINSI